MMTRSGPINALLTGLLVLPLVVAGSGSAAGVCDDEAMQGVPMRGMPMQGMEMAAPSTSGSAEPGAPSSESVVPSSRSDDVPCSGATPCEMPGMPFGCPSMLLCHSGASLPAHAESVLAAFSHNLRPAPLAVRAFHARLSPPELPPPRA
jgi:hypothetical protein